MSGRRRLPILKAESRDAPVPAEAEETPPPPWHWVPLGALVTLISGALLARVLYIPFLARQVTRVYGSAHTQAEMDRIDATVTAATRTALRWKLFAAAVPIAVIALLAGGYVVTRFGERTNARHGTLAGVTATGLLVAFAGRAAHTLAEALAYAMLVPIGAALGYVGGRLGAARTGTTEGSPESPV